LKIAHEYFANGILVSNCDAVLYAFRESPAYTYTEPKQKFTPGTKEWADEQVTIMEQSAIEHFEAEAARDDPWAY